MFAGDGETEIAFGRTVLVADVGGKNSVGQQRTDEVALVFFVGWKDGVDWNRSVQAEALEIFLERAAEVGVFEELSCSDGGGAVREREWRGARDDSAFFGDGV